MGGVGVKRGGCGKNKMRTNRWMSMENVKQNQGVTVGLSFSTRCLGLTDGVVLVRIGQVKPHTETEVLIVLN